MTQRPPDAPIQVGHTTQLYAFAPGTWNGDMKITRAPIGMLAPPLTASSVLHRPLNQTAGDKLSRFL